MEDIRLIKDVDETRRDTQQFYECCAMIIKCSKVYWCVYEAESSRASDMARRAVRGARAQSWHIKSGNYAA